MTSPLDTALNLLAAGISVIPVGANKVPRIQWKPFIERLPTVDELSEWFETAEVVGVGRVCGAVSGNLETIDFDVDADADRDAFPFDSSSLLKAWRDQVEALAPGLAERLTVIRTPRPGWHVCYRCAEPVEGNQKLAEVPKIKGGWKAVIETRGEGGYCLHPGSPGACHPTGREYAHSRGPLIEAAEPISAEERLILLQAARLFNRKPDRDDTPRPAPRPAGPAGLTPGDDFNAKAEWRDILEPHGFKRVNSGDVEHWRRPGTANQISLTCGYGGSGYLYAFSPNCGFEANRGYSKFAAFAILNHAGDFAEAATELARRGYGSPAIEVLPAEDELPDPPPPLKAPAFPTDLLGVPGIIQAVTEHTNRTSFVKQPALALGAAVALMGTITGRKVRDVSGTCPNVYVVGLCRSGGGKERARQVNNDLLYLAGQSALIGPEGFASGAGIVNALVTSATHSMLFQVDEIGRMLEIIKKAGPSAGHLASIPTTLMRLYTSSPSIFKSDAYAEGDKKNKEIQRPNACLYGTSVPDNFWGSITRSSLTDGFMSRLLVIEGDNTARPGPSAIADPPPATVDLVRRWCEYEAQKGNNLASQSGYHDTIPYTDAGLILMDAFQVEAIEHQFAHGDIENALWSRAVEKARKLALIFACSAYFEDPIIDADAVEWATGVTRFLTLRMIAEASRRVSENVTEENFNRILRIIEDAGRITATELQKRTRWLKSKDRTDIINDLIEEGRIAVANCGTATKSSKVYQVTAL